MKKEIKLSIDTPCSEKFENFTPTEKGGFCASCSKEVVDFTSMTDQEIVNYFDKPEDNTCGRFRQAQLKSYALPQAQNHRNYAALGVVGLSLVSLLASASVEAQEKKPPVIEVWAPKMKDSTKVFESEKGKGIIAEGIIVDKDGSLPGVSVLIKGTVFGTDTDFDGKFKLERPIKSGTTLVFSYLGYETVEVVIGSKTKMPLRVTMKESEEITIGLIIAGEVQVEKLFKSKKSSFKKRKKKGS